MKVIKAIVFDWGGVLIDDPAPGLIKYCGEALGVTESAFLEAQNMHLPKFNSGVIAEDVFWQNMCNDLQVSSPQPPTLWGEAFRKVYAPRSQVFAWAEQLHQQNYIIGLLSNTEPPAMEHFKAQNYEMFNFTVFSCAEGTHKPDSLIYKKMIEETGVLPEEVLYLDDKEKYVEAARQNNVESQRVRSVEEIKQVFLDYKLPIS